MLVVSANQGTFTRCIRLVIADRQPIVLQGLRSVLAAQRDFEIVASCSTGTSCLEAIRNLAPDVALLANALPDVTISEILAIAQAEHLPTRLVLFTESETDDDLTLTIADGACCAISKYADPDTILRSLRLMTERVSASPERSQDLSPNGKGIDGAKIEKMLGLLTHRESQVVRLVSEGLSNKEIARQLNISQGTVKVHLHNIFQKLEISNRTVLATIALLQRPASFGTLSLAALAFAISDDVKALEAKNTFLDDDSTAYKDPERPAFELWKKAILRHVIVVDPGETVPLIQRGSSAKVSQAANPAARMEELHAAEHAALSNLARGHGPIGSSTPYLFVSPLLQAINNSQADGPTAQQQFPSLAFASNPINKPGGYGAFALPAVGAWIYALDDSHAASQAPNPGETLIDTSTVANLDSTTQVATIAIHGAGGVNSDDDNLAPGPAVHDAHLQLAFAPPAHESVTGGNADQIIHGGAGDDTLNGGALANIIYGGSANDTIKNDGGHDTIYGGSSSDTINGNDAIIGGYGSDQLMGGNGDDIFFYSSAIDSNSNQFDTIVDFISGADKINLAALGALAFLHLTSTSTSVPPHTIAWIYNPASNETIIYVNPTDDSLDIGDPGLLEIHLQGVISVAESDFVYEREAAAVAAALEGIDPALLMATASDGTVLTTDSARASIEAATSDSAPVAGIWTMPADDGLRFHFERDRIGSTASIRLASFGEDAAYATEESDDGAVTAPAHVSSIELAYSHATVPTEEHPAFKKEPVQANTGAVTNGQGKAHATAGLELPEFGMQSAVISAPVLESDEPSVAADNSGGHGNSKHASQPASAKASAAAELTESGVTSDHSNSQHPPHSSSAKALAAGELTEPDVTHGVGRSNSAHASNSAAAKASSAAELAESGVTSDHSNSQHPPHSASAKALAAGELTEPDVTHGVGHSNSAHASNSAAAKASPAAELAESGVTTSHGNSQHPSHSASAKALGSTESVETGVALGKGSGHGSSPEASQSAAAKALAAAEPAGPDLTTGKSGGNGNGQYASHSAAANGSADAQRAEPASVTGGAGHEPAFRFKKQADASTPTAAVEPGELNDSAVLLGHGAELAAILEVGPAAMEEHPAGHVHHGHHYAVVHLPHDLLT
ncbi:VCBS domain-containing protein [Bradyrhizobium sp. WSM 1738]|uniref:LuxR C-terminal-related transcriptional regulator n=1 Tax=Bradyrhizobium hereditatis TaxID=2821405 RepID=UPI001CE29297|nr:LuxR C-terminal-related transcriptional regulator [Bradyrhizobium hereditatis]MCA6115886.1 VCBS domain-containing protein [Bradyrhizobium hereditatis]